MASSRMVMLASTVVYAMVMLSPVDCTGTVMQLRKRVTPPFSSPQQHFEQAVAHDRARHPRMFSGVVNFPIFGNADPSVLGEYYTTVHLGTPPQEFHLQFDTGSDLLWVACSGCTGCPVSTSIDIHLNWFDVSSSATARVVPCSDHVCTSTVQCSDHCYYEMSYQDGSATVGYYLTDLLQFDAVAPQTILHYSDAVVFGCSINESGRLNKTLNVLDGIVGFGQGKLSLISQLAYKKITPGIFCHCLGGDGSGTLVLGEVVNPGIVYTPLLPLGPHYNVDLRRISINGRTVYATGATQPTIIDSGSTASYLVEEVYDALVHGITSAIAILVTPILIEDVQCYQDPNSTILPSITLDFSSGSSMASSMEDYLTDLGSNMVAGVRLRCITFQRAQLNILGDNVLKNKIVVYDLESQRVAWTSYNCSLPVNVSSTYSGVSTAASLMSVNELLFLFVYVLISFALVNSQTERQTVWCQLPLYNICVALNELLLGCNLMAAFVSVDVFFQLEQDF